MSTHTPMFYLVLKQIFFVCSQSNFELCSRSMVRRTHNATANNDDSKSDKQSRYMYRNWLDNTFKLPSRKLPLERVKQVTNHVVTCINTVFQRLRGTRRL